MVLVYRVEHSVHGGGPYRPYGQDHDRLGDPFWPDGADEELQLLSEAMNDAHGFWTGDADGVYRPAGSADGLSRQPRHVFGCPSVATLRRWFQSYGSQLEGTGFVVALYAVPATHVRRGRSNMQVVFDPERATRVRTHAPTQYIS